MPCYVVERGEKKRRIWFFYFFKGCIICIAKKKQQKKQKKNPKNQNQNNNNKPPPPSPLQKRNPQNKHQHPMSHNLICCCAPDAKICKGLPGDETWQHLLQQPANICTAPPALGVCREGVVAPGHPTNPAHISTAE